MGLQLTDAEQDALLTTAHTAIITTLRRDGWPVTLPVWFIWTAGHVYIGTPPGSAKVKRIRRDNRCSVLIESGQAWVDLAAVEYTARSVQLDPGPEADSVAELLDKKYSAFRPAQDRLPPAVQQHYAEQIYYRLDPVGHIISWDNSKIRLVPPSR